MRRRADGTAVDQVDMTYVVVAIAEGLRIAVMAVRQAVRAD